MEFVKCANDREYFMRKYLYVQHPSDGAVLFHPRDYQQEMLDLMEEYRFLIMNLPRQSGKTSSSIGFLLHAAIFTPNETIGITSNRQINVKDIMGRIRYSYENLPWWLKPPVTEYSKFKISFAVNHSSIEGATTTESTFRGRSMTKLFLDEFAHVKPVIAEEFWTSILPVISAAGEDSAKTQIIIASTPNGTEGQYARLWFGAVNGDNGFKEYKVYPDRIPGRDANFKREMLRKMTYEKYMQEYEGAFLSSKSTLVNSTVLESIRPKEPISGSNDDLLLFGDFRNKTVAICCDVGEGVGKDFHAIQIFDIDGMEQLGEWRNNVMTQTQFTHVIINVIRMIHNSGAKEIYYTVENNSIGMGVINLLINSDDSALNHAIMVSDIKHRKKGIPTNTASKARGCMLLKDLVEGWKLKLHSKRLLTELKFFVKSGASFASERGRGEGHDDLTMACVLFCNMLDLLAHYEESVYDLLNNIHLQDEEEDSLSHTPMPIIFGGETDPFNDSV